MLWKGKQFRTASLVAPVMLLMLKIWQKVIFKDKSSTRFMVFKATFTNMSVITWRSVFLVEYPEKLTNLSQVTDKNLSHIVVSSTIWNMDCDCDWNKTRHIDGQLWHRYSATVNQVMMVTKAFEVIASTLPLGKLAE